MLRVSLVFVQILCFVISIETDDKSQGRFKSCEVLFRTES